MTFGRRGVFGPALSALGIEIGFTTAAVVIAESFVAAPFYVRAAKVGFEGTDWLIPDDRFAPMRLDLRDVSTVRPKELYDGAPVGVGAESSSAQPEWAGTLTVVICTRTRPAGLLATLGSLVRQSRTDFERTASLCR